MADRRSRRLAVQLYGVVVGHIVYSDQDTRDFDFRVSPQALDRFSLHSRILSLAVPLDIAPDKKRVQHRRNFFHGLIPEGKARLNLARLTGVAPEDTIGLLAARGLDLAGALMIYGDDNEPEISAEARPVSNRQIRQMLESDEEFPLGNVRETGRTSLAGFQDKIVLAQKDGQWHLAENGVPSTHIIKPHTNRWPSLIYDEAWSLQLARAIGLVGYDSFLYDFNGLDALVIERYDRDPAVEGYRVHQEDFAQAFGIPDERKYEELGEAWSLERVADALYHHAGNTDIKDFARQIIYALATGNLDMHAKNIGLLHLPDETLRLAPAYDIPPLAHHGLGENLAFRVDGVIKHSQVSTEHILKEFLNWEVEPFASRSATRAFILAELEAIAAAVSRMRLPDKACPGLVADVKANLKRLLRGTHG
ncbi:MAG: HipA domain-containing protein [Coriobacteriales bacterium]|jgi:serine/threonine-protein kinase HipA|nr:HipA domain-containing protein [Coriobacteriales bacterium]